jgi:hypothetical protein
MEQERPKRAEGFRVEQIDDEILLFHPTDRKVLSVNPTASVVWQLCDGERTVAEMVDLLMDAYPEASSSIEKDVRSIVAEFAEHGAVESA